MPKYTIGSQTTRNEYPVFIWILQPDIQIQPDLASLYQNETRTRTETHVEAEEGSDLDSSSQLCQLNPILQQKEDK